MKNAKEYCTCTDTKCPCHPVNHDQGCNLCIQKNLRQKEILDLRSVQYVILETDGNLSVFPYPKTQPAAAADAGIRVKPQHLPVTIIQDGILLPENLVKAHKDNAWLQSVLEEHRTEITATFLLTVDDQGHTLWIGKEGCP